MAAKAIEDADPHSSVTFVHLACSGADTLALTHPYIGQELTGTTAENCATSVNGKNACPNIAKPHTCFWGVCFPLLPPQIDEIARLLCPVHLGSDSNGNIPYGNERCPDGAGGRSIDFLIVSIGANNIGFGDIVKGCAALQNCHLRHTHNAWPDSLNDAVRAIQGVEVRIDGLTQTYATLGYSIERTLPVKRTSVVITEYFDPTRDDSGNYCDPALRNTQEVAESELGGWWPRAWRDVVDQVVDFDGLTTGELIWAYNNVLVPMNEKIKAAANQQQWKFAGGIQSAFRRHGVCANGNWVNGLTGSSERQGNLEGAMHPNMLGHEAYRDAIVRAISSH